MTYTRKDYPLAEAHPEKISGARGKPLSALTLDAVLAGDVTIEDLRITPKALHDQADISRSANRPRLADNFIRAAELVDVPQDLIMRTYELLRPGRAHAKSELHDLAALYRSTYKADKIAAFIEEAAEVYETRGLFKKRF
jgi:propanediol dehydratase small subunit